ncbi:MAG: hypothetical protein ABIL18_05470 [candidate division WOR-3 bacterium]
MKPRLSTLLCLLVISCGDLTVQWFSEFSPVGSGDCHINNICYFKNFYVTGYSKLNGIRSAIIAQYDNTGRLSWFKINENNRNKFSEGLWVTATTEFSLKNNGVIYQLMKTCDFEENNKLYLIKYDSLGKVVWEKVVQESKYEISGQIFVGRDFAIYIVGMIDCKSDSGKIFIKKYSAAGIEYISNEYSLKSLRIGNCKFLLTNSKEIVTAGVLKDRNNLFYLRFDSLGAFKEMIEYKSVEDEVDLCDFKIDEMGNLYLTGIVWGINSKFDWITIVYNKDNSLRWVKRYDGLAHQDDIPMGILVDDSLNVYVAGGTNKSENMCDILLIKYNANGDTLWAKNFSTEERGESITPFFLNTDITRPIRWKGINFLYITALSSNKIILLKYNLEGRLIKCYRYSLKDKPIKLTAQDGLFIALECDEENITKSYLLGLGRFELLGINRWD